MAAGLVDCSGTLRQRAQVPTQAEGPTADGEVLWRTLADLVCQVRLGAAEGDRIVVCGVGCGGPVRPGGEAGSPVNTEGWRNSPLRSRVCELTGAPTSVDNDAKALALGEGWV